MQLNAWAINRVTNDLIVHKHRDIGMTETQTNRLGLDDDNDDLPSLSAETFKALQEFYAEKEAVEKNIDENWQLSQFWYDKATSERLSKEVLTNAVKSLTSGSDSFNIGCISCPTLFKSLHYYVRDLKSHPDVPEFASLVDKIDVKLFEYDRRFEMYGRDFIFYDYKSPLAIDSGYHGYFDFIISDPPYLSDECHVKTGMTIKKIGKADHKLLICTGAVMEDLLGACFRVKLNAFVPRHERNLANEFKCYSNYDTLYLD